LFACVEWQQIGFVFESMLGFYVAYGSCISLFVAVVALEKNDKKQTLLPIFVSLPKSHPNPTTI
jgi:hypothetical protein